MSDRQTDRQPDRQKDRHRQTYRPRSNELKVRERERQTDR